MRFDFTHMKKYVNENQNEEALLMEMMPQMSLNDKTLKTTNQTTECTKSKPVKNVYNLNDSNCGTVTNTNTCSIQNPSAAQLMRDSFTEKEYWLVDQCGVLTSEHFYPTESKGRIGSLFAFASTIWTAIVILVVLYAVAEHLRIVLEM